MKYLIFIFLIFLNFSCSNNRSVYWCGDHACINNKERKAYFKTTMIMEKRNISNKIYKDKSEANKIIKQAKSNEKKRISDEKKFLNEEKINRKKETKNKKEFAKQSKKERKNKIKEQKKLDKLANIKEKKLIKSEKKLSKKNLSSNKDQFNLKDKEIKAQIENKYFDQLVQKILKKNSLKDYPDINKTPE